jgi:transcriptional regulator GlxA family with amidase domain
MSSFSSDFGLDTVRDVTGNGTEVDVATDLLTGDVRLSILWTQEILLSPDAAEEVAQALRRAAQQGRMIAGVETPGSTSTSVTQDSPEAE